MAQSNVVRLRLASNRPRLPIKSVYYFGKNIVRKNSSSNPLRSVGRCVQHLRLNSYEATHAEIFDELRGVLHAVIKRDVNGNIHVLYEHGLQKKIEVI